MVFYNLGFDKIIWLTVHARAPWSPRNYSINYVDCWDRTVSRKKIWGRVKKFLQHWKTQRVQQLPSSVNRRSLEGFFLELAAKPMWAMVRRWAECRWPRIQWSLWQSSSLALWREKRFPEGQLFLKLSTSKACMVEWSDGSHSSGKDTW